MKNHHIHKITFIPLFTSLIVVGTVIIPPITLLTIPVTLQTFFVMLTGLLLKPKDSFLAIFLYLLLGILGLPVFSGGASGIAPILGPTGGFILSFPIAAFFISWQARQRQHFMAQLTYCLLFGVGLVYLIAIPIFSLHLDYTIKEGIIAFGAFMIIDTIKAVLSVIISKRLTQFTSSYTM